MISSYNYDVADSCLLGKRTLYFLPRVALGFNGSLNISRRGPGLFRFVLPFVALGPGDFCAVLGAAPSRLLLRGCHHGLLKRVCDRVEKS
jgi:hypothetical protein